ncbi:MAG: hypothetical protein AAF919_13200 [Pseudomonadota bacterium]
MTDDIAEVSGTYRLSPASGGAGDPVAQGQIAVIVRVDVDRADPQNLISVEVSRQVPRSAAHIVAEVTADAPNQQGRVIEALVSYRDGDQALIPGPRLTFTWTTDGARLDVSGADTVPRSYDLTFESPRFDPVEFEVDVVEGAGPAVTSYATDAHPNRPADLPAETLDLNTVFARAGFAATTSAGSGPIPVDGAGVNGTWSDSEMHNAMVTYWSRFSDNPAWAMWVLYAGRHDTGPSLGGVMFDSIGPNHRQGTAIFTDSFIRDAPANDPAPAAWRDRMQFWTAIHEMGHAFNMAHSWQKALGVESGGPGDPWIPLANQPEIRSFMNYPFRVQGGQEAFFSDFRFRFSDQELAFLRHAPRRFVRMGDSDWFVNHGFEAPGAVQGSGTWRLALRPSRETATYAFLEPVMAELKLTNISDMARDIGPDFLEDGTHVTLYVGREGAATRRWRPMVSYCHETHRHGLPPGASIYGAHMIGASARGWLVDAPGFYKLQAAVTLGDEIVLSNVLRIQVAPPSTAEEAALADDYFHEDVARVLAFDGCPVLGGAQDTLRRLCAVAPTHPAATHAEIALSAPSLRDYKLLEARGPHDLRITTRAARVAEARTVQQDALLKAPDRAADTLGHIGYFDHLTGLAQAVEAEGDTGAARDLLTRTVSVMKARNVLSSVVETTQARLGRTD